MLECTIHVNASITAPTGGMNKEGSDKEYEGNSECNMLPITLYVNINISKLCR